MFRILADSQDAEAEVGVLQASPRRLQLAPRLEAVARPITVLAVGCVVFTTCAVAAVAHWLLGMPLAVGFVLGAIVSPPDVVAPLSIVRRLGVPRRLVVILEGEGLANDATALILIRTAKVRPMICEARWALKLRSRSAAVPCYPFGWKHDLRHGARGERGPNGVTR